MKRFGSESWALVCLGLWITFFSALAGAQQIGLTPSSLNFGGVSLGSSNTQAVRVTNITGSKISISQASVSGTGYTISGIVLPTVLYGGQSTSFNVTFTPPSAGTDSGVVSLVSQFQTKIQKRRYWPQTSVLALSGTGVSSGQIAASPSSVAFGNVMVGNSQTFPDAVTNNGSADVTISQVAMSNAAYTVSGLIPPVTLTAGQSLTFNISFTPGVAGSSSGNLAISSNAQNSQLNVGLSGTGVAPGQLALTPSTYNFGSIDTGTTAAMTGTLTATGSTVTISSASSSSSEFLLSGVAFPVTLANGQSIPFTATFVPQISGTASGSITFLSNAANSPTTETLNGTGITPTQHTVDLSWDASTTPGIVGYKVYRSSVSGGPYGLVTTSPDPALIFSDTTVTAGQTYYYAVTALDNDGVESTYSNEIQAIVPSP